MKAVGSLTFRNKMKIKRPCNTSIPAKYFRCNLLLLLFAHFKYRQAIIMKSMHLSAAFVAPILVLGTLSALPSSVLAEVKSLTSSELTETFIKDSTIIVTPKQQQKATRQKTITSLTITPSDVTKSELEEIKHVDDHLNSTAVALSEEDMRNSSVKRSIKRVLDEAENPIDIASYDEISAPLPISEMLSDSRYAVPEGDQWARMYAGSQLGISLTGDQFTFSIGTPEGVGPIGIPEAVHGDDIHIVPRIGGGFDVTVTVPSQD